MIVSRMEDKKTITNNKEIMMRTCLATFYPPANDRLRFSKQLGIDDVIVWATTYQTKEERSYKNLIALRKRLKMWA